jgi:hypothetical protein
VIAAQHALDVAFTLSVTGAAMLGATIFGPVGAGLALFVAAGYFVASAVIADRRAVEK